MHAQRGLFAELYTREYQIIAYLWNGLIVNIDSFLYLLDKIIIFFILSFLHQVVVFENWEKSVWWDLFCKLEQQTEDEACQYIQNYHGINVLIARFNDADPGIAERAVISDEWLKKNMDKLEEAVG